MGRWGHCLSQSDFDLDLAGDVTVDIAGEAEGAEYDVVSSYGSTKIFTDGQAVDGSAVLATVRQKLDAGFADSLMKKYHNEYQLIILGAVLMSTGAQINEGDLQHLRQLASEAGSSESFVLFDMGFRGPGKRQFLAALDNYKAGTPRDFTETSCHACGLTKTDTGKAPLMCGRCSDAWFCDRQCQRSFWGVHKHRCAIRTGLFLNV